MAGKSNRTVPLYTQIANELKEQILSGVFRPGDRLPSENELAKHFCVSTITSKRALNDLFDSNLIIRIKGKGSFVAGKDGLDILNSRKSSFKGIIGIIIPTFCMPVESSLFYLIQSHMHDLGYHTLIRVTDDHIGKEKEAINMFLAFGVRGIIIFPAILSDSYVPYDEEILRLSLDRFPHVLIDRNLPHLISSSVVSDNKEAAIEVIEHLLEEGHTDILLFTQRDTNSTTHERMMGFEEGFVRHGIKIDKSKWFTANFHVGDVELEQSLEAFLKMHPNATAGVAIDTPLASMAYALLHQSGKPIPEQFKLISFDNPRLPFVPYVKQDVARISKRAIEILMSQIEGSYKVVSEKIPAIFIKDVTYPSPFGIENI